VTTAISRLAGLKNITWIEVKTSKNLHPNFIPYKYLKKKFCKNALAGVGRLIGEVNLPMLEAMAPCAAEMLAFALTFVSIPVSVTLTKYTSLSEHYGNGVSELPQFGISASVPPPPAICLLFIFVTH